MAKIWQLKWNRPIICKTQTTKTHISSHCLPGPVLTSFSTATPFTKVLPSFKALSLSHQSIQTSSDSFQKPIRIFSATRKYNSLRNPTHLANNWSLRRIYWRLLEIIFLVILWIYKPIYKPISMSHVPGTLFYHPSICHSSFPYIFIPVLPCASSSQLPSNCSSSS